MRTLLRGSLARAEVQLAQAVVLPVHNVHRVGGENRYWPPKDMPTPRADCAYLAGARGVAAAAAIAVDGRGFARNS